MAPATHIPGKDASLEDTIARAVSLLQSMDLPAEAVSWQNPAPDCWSVHLRSTSCSSLYTNGKGTSQQAALASALGEFFERLSTNFFFADFFLDDGMMKTPFLFYPNEKWFPPGSASALPNKAPDGTVLLNTYLRDFYNPTGELTFEHLCDNNTNSTRRGICALPFIDAITAEKVYFPVSLLNNLYVSNGMAAGNSRTECCAQALSEIIERYVKNIIISKGISLPDVPLTVLNRFPRLCCIIDRLAEKGLIIRVKDGSLGGQFPVICALLTDTANGGVYAAFGANFRFETAIERTLTELLQGRNLEVLRNFQPPSHHLLEVADPFNLESHFVDSDGLLAWTMFRNKADFPFSPWDFQGSTAMECTRLQALIADQGKRLYISEYTHCGMYSCRILVPGMSEIYPVDDLVYNNRSFGSTLRADILRLPGLSNPALLDFLDKLESISLNDQQSLAHIIGIAFDDDSAWSSLRIGELKALLHLALQNHEEAQHWCTWCLDHAALPDKRRRLYRLLCTLLGFSLTGQRASDYADSLALLYDAGECSSGQAILDGQLTFPGLTFAGSWREVSKEYDKILQIYSKLNDIKLSANW
jgi:ribosomal protein S12 methylthiotransferase accessory factor